MPQNSLANKWNSELLTMRCCVIEGRKFSILSNKEKGNFYSAECYFFLCRYAIATENKVIEEKGTVNKNIGGGGRGGDFVIFAGKALLLVVLSGLLATSFVKFSCR